MWTKFDYACMDTAYRWAELSHAKRKKVGAVFAKNNRPIMTSFNGNPSQLDNCCEGEDGKTLPSVVHAEANGIVAAAREGISLQGTTLYVTCTPCTACTSLIISVGVSRLVYHEHYVSGSKGCDLKSFEDAGIMVQQFKEYTKE